jgi:hypothetical protein
VKTQIAFLDDHVRPCSLAEVGFAHNLTWARQESAQNIEGPTAYGNELAIALEAALQGKNTKFAELERLTDSINRRLSGQVRHQGAWMRHARLINSRRSTTLHFREVERATLSAPDVA